MSHPIQLLKEVRPKVRRGRGEGRIYRRGRIWWIQYYRNGRRVFESSGSENERTALNLLRRRLGQVAAGIAPLPHAQKISYENLRDALLADYAANRRKWLRIGKGAENVKRAAESGRPLRDVAIELGVDEETYDKAMDLRQMARGNL